jgi:hypothetical protein
VEPVINPLQAGNANFHFMELGTLKDLYIHELKDLHSAERQRLLNASSIMKWRATARLAVMLNF